MIKAKLDGFLSHKLKIFFLNCETQKTHENQKYLWNVIVLHSREKQIRGEKTKPQTAAVIWFAVCS